MKFDTIIYEEDGPIGTITLNRPDDGNMFTVDTCREVRECIDAIRRETRTRVIVLTGAGDKFFCIGGRKDNMEKTTLYAGVLPSRSTSCRSRSLPALTDSQSAEVTCSKLSAT